MLISQLVLRTSLRSTAAPHRQSTQKICGRKWIMVDHLPLIVMFARSRSRNHSRNEYQWMIKPIVHTHRHSVGVRTRVVVLPRVQVMCGANETGRKSDEKRKWLLSCTAQNNNEKWREKIEMCRSCGHVMCTPIPIQFVWFWKKRNTKTRKEYQFLSSSFFNWIFFFSFSTLLAERTSVYIWNDWIVRCEFISTEPTNRPRLFLLACNFVVGELLSGKS